MAIGDKMEQARAALAEPPKPKYGPNDMVSVQVPRWVAQDLAKQANNPKISPGPNPGNERIILIKGRDRQELEQLFQTTIDGPSQLISRVRRLCAVQINGVEHTFTADELARFQMQAKFHGRTTEQFMTEMMGEVIGRMLEQV